MRGGSARGFPAGRGSGRAAAPARRPSGHRARRRRGTAVVRAWSARVFQTAGQVVRRACPASDPSTAPECSLMSSAIEESLRSEVRMLGAVLGDTLRAHEGEPLFDLVEQVRARTKSLRLSPGQPDDAELAALLDRVDLATAGRLVRAFATYFQLVNLAELEWLDRAGPAGGSPAVFDDLLARCRQGNLPKGAVRHLLEGLDVVPVLTAHPTEAVRRSILDRQDRIGAQLGGL